jgi:hypothetical protein
MPTARQWANSVRLEVAAVTFAQATTGLVLLGAAGIGSLVGRSALIAESLAL